MFINFRVLHTDLLQMAFFDIVCFLVLVCLCDIIRSRNTKNCMRN